MTKKQSRLEKVREKDEKIEESPEKEEILVENIPKVEPNTKTYLVKDILVGSR